MNLKEVVLIHDNSFHKYNPDLNIWTPLRDGKDEPCEFNIRESKRETEMRP